MLSMDRAAVATELAAAVDELRPLMEER